MNIKELASRILDVTFDFNVTEIPSDGVTVYYDGVSAKVGGVTTPALARAYMLLAKGISEGKQSISITQSAYFDMCGVMLDMSFGSVTKPAGVKKYLDYMALFGMNMLMLYTEDTYEVEQYPLFGYQRGRYTLTELQDLDNYAAELGIEIIPCIQTFGHMKQFLRYKANAAIKENETVLLPGEEQTYELIDACIATCRKAFRTSRIHIGCDETRGLGFGKSFKRDGYRDRFEIFNEHISRVVNICKKYDFRPMMWSDMYFSLAGKTGRAFALDAVVPQYAIDSMPEADMVFWEYYKKENEFYDHNIKVHQTFNRKTIFAGGIWTWNGQAPNFTHTYDTATPGLQECVRHGVREVFAAAWAYGDINHIQALPCLALYSDSCWRGNDVTREEIEELAEFVTGLNGEMCEAISDFYCDEGGDRNVGKALLWSDPLINLLCYDYDLPKYATFFERALAVFDKYPNAPYCDFYKVLFRCTLAKTRLQINLRKHYKAKDTAWLKEFSETTLPEMQKDFETLYTMHEKLWHEECKTHGWEKLGNAYAAAISRIAYAKREIGRYLNGEIDEIEALEPEIVQGVRQTGIMAHTVMNSYL